MLDRSRARWRIFPSSRYPDLAAITPGCSCLLRRCHSALADAEASHELVVLDLRNLSFMDSTGLRLIVVAERRARESGHRLVIVEGPPWVQRLFEVTGLDTWLDVRSDPSQSSS